MEIEKVITVIGLVILLIAWLAFVAWLFIQTNNETEGWE
jgi:hypothetical protein